MNAQERKAYQLAVKLGMLPTDAEDAINAAGKAGQALPTAKDAKKDAEVTDADIERARQWWLLNAPNEFKRLLGDEGENAA